MVGAVRVVSAGADCAGVEDEARAAGWTVSVAAAGAGDDVGAGARAAAGAGADALTLPPEELDGPRGTSDRPRNSLGSRERCSVAGGVACGCEGGGLRSPRVYAGGLRTIGVVGVVVAAAGVGAEKFDC